MAESGINLVTGAGGFIGGYLCRHLGQTGVKVRVLAHLRPEKIVVRPAAPDRDATFFCDLGQEPLPPELMAGVDTVYHLAGLAHAFKPPSALAHQYRTVNVEATAELLSLARCAGVRRFIYFSSVKAMADPGEHCVDESWQEWPADPYGRSKREAEALVLQAGGPGGMHVCNLRPALVYGVGVKGNLDRMLRAVAAGRFPLVPDTGNRRTLVHVADLVQAALLAAESAVANGKTYIVTDGKQYSTREILDLMRQALGKKKAVWSVPAFLFRGGGVLGDLGARLCGRRLPLNTEAVARLLGSACYENGKIQNELGFRPQWDLAAAMAEMAQPYRRRQVG